MTRLGCPNCGNDQVSSNDTVPATAHGYWEVGADGEPAFEGGGWTDIGWDGQAPVEGEEGFCTECLWVGPAAALVPQT